MSTASRPRSKAHRLSATAAGTRLLETYAVLASRGEHLLQRLLGGSAPTQWRHYPQDDAIDAQRGYQWFYHSHSPEDRPGAVEHGHFHLFARRPLWWRRMQSSAEKAFTSLTGNPSQRVNTRHLISISLDAKGLPISLFTVNSWVTGDLMLSASGTERLLMDMRLETGHTEIDTLLECVIALCEPDIHQLLLTRDISLASRAANSVLEDRGMEILSETAVDLDQKLAAL